MADLDTACCNILSSKQLTNAAVVVSVMVVWWKEEEGRTGLNCGCTRSASAQEVEEECGVYVC